MKSILLAIFVALPNMLLHAQETFVQRIDIGVSAEAHAIISTSDGGFVVAGAFYDDTTGLVSHPFLMKLNASGAITWTKALLFATHPTDTVTGYFTSVAETPDHGYVATGSATISKLVYIMKFDALGEMMWARSLGGVNYGAGASIVSTKDAGFLISGNDERTNNIFFAKVVESSTTENLAYGKDILNWENGSSTAIEGQDGNFLLVRTSVDSIRMAPNAAVMKVAPTGQVLWSFRYGQFPVMITDHCMTATSDGGSAICDITEGGNTSNFEGMFVTKLDADGKLLWRKAVEVFENARGSAITEATNGDLIVTGYRFSSSFSITDLPPNFDTMFIVRIDKNGSALDGNILNIPAFRSEPQSIARTSDDGFVMAGLVTLPGCTRRSGVLLVKCSGSMGTCSGKTSLVADAEDKMKLISAAGTKELPSTDNMENFTATDLTNSITSLCASSDVSDMPPPTSAGLAIFPNPASGSGM
ncbi:MAG: hypothetical protein Q8919_14820, partial [Bacteroidota bacterium]|nr:hypothetical protein [Bacteroidota bacterium]